MTTIRRALIAAPLAALAVGAYVLAAWAQPSKHSGAGQSAPIAAMADRGLSVVGQFDAPAALTGYAASSRNGRWRSISHRMASMPSSAR